MRTQSDRDTYIRMKSKGFTLTQCSLALGVSKRTLQRWNKSSIQSRPLARIHLRKLAHEHTAFILIYIDHSPTTTIRELRTIIRQRFTVNVSKDTIWRFLRASNLTYKKATKRYTEANPEHQQAFLQVLRANPPLRLIAVDEAAFFLNHSRGYAWAEKGKRALVPRPGIRGKMKSLILAVSREGVVAWTLFEGAVTAERFVGFLDLLPQDSTLLLDNASIHRVTKSLSKKGLSTVPARAQQRRIELRYLPPYSPQLNPAELCFNLLRGRINGRMPRTEVDLNGSVEMAIGKLSPQFCSNIIDKVLFQ